MLVKTYNTFNRWNKFFTLLISIIVLSLLTGCATTGGNYEKLEFNRELDNKFLNYQVLPSHSYYITGGYGAPSAILAIHIDYQLDNEANLWVPVPDVSSAHLKKWISGISFDRTDGIEMLYSAYYILNPAGKRIGAWYSRQKHTTVKFPEGNIVNVYTPNPDPVLLQRRGRGR